MSFENLDMESLTEARRKSIEETIDPIDVNQLKTLGEGLFPSMEHPWREVFFQFIAENAGASFYHATTSDRVHIIYCSTKEKGMWFRPGSGMGPLQEKGLRILKEIVKGH